MKAGKSERLIEEIENEEDTKFIIKPIADTRDGAFVRTRAHDRKYSAIMIDENNSQMIEMLFGSVNRTYSIFIDEVQFFSETFIKNLVNYCDTYGTNLIVSGLLLDFKGNYFPSSQYMLHYSDEVILLEGQCDYCKSKENTRDILVDSKTNRLILAGNSFKVEGADNSAEYKVACRSCHSVLVAKRLEA